MTSGTASVCSWCRSSKLLEYLVVYRIWPALSIGNVLVYPSFTGEKTNPNPVMATSILAESKD